MSYLTNLLTLIQQSSTILAIGALILALWQLKLKFYSEKVKANIDLTKHFYELMTIANNRVDEKANVGLSTQNAITTSIAILGNEHKILRKSAIEGLRGLKNDSSKSPDRVALIETLIKNLEEKRCFCLLPFWKNRR